VDQGSSLGSRDLEALPGASFQGSPVRSKATMRTFLRDDGCDAAIHKLECHLSGQLVLFIRLGIDIFK
jgi:hypothetical protein